MILSPHPFRTTSTYYLVKGDVEEVLKANDDPRVTRSEWVRPETEAVEYDKVGITDGLVDYLAEKGIEEDYQTKGLDWVQDTVDNKKTDGVTAI